ncbi:hypothetical protein TNCV_2972271 [Trichonephila clavipes]|nr:hypothetical protein TNCV_2972271 [Trichonephila clavipes]
MISLLSTAIPKIIPEVLECNTMSLTVFAKDLLVSEDLLIYSFSSPSPIHHIRLPTRKTVALTSYWDISDYIDPWLVTPLKKADITGAVASNAPDRCILGECQELHAMLRNDMSVYGCPYDFQHLVTRGMWTRQDFVPKDPVIFGTESGGTMCKSMFLLIKN